MMPQLSKDSKGFIRENLMDLKQGDRFITTLHGNPSVYEFSQKLIGGYAECKNERTGKMRKIELNISVYRLKKLHESFEDVFGSDDVDLTPFY